MDANCSLFRLRKFCQILPTAMHSYRSKAYTAFLSLLSLTARRRWAVRATRHLITILLVAFAVYFYRDFWSFATYNGVPADLVEGIYLWPKFGVLSFVSVAVPLIMPGQYIPLDPKVRFTRLLQSLLHIHASEAPARIAQQRTDCFYILLYDVFVPGFNRIQSL